MLQAISNTSPLLYLYRIEAIDWLPNLFDEVWAPEAVYNELRTGRSKGYDTPNPDSYSWLHVVNPKAMPSEWLALALENPSRIVLLDDMLARRTAQAAGLQVWGTLKVLLEAKSQGLVNQIEPYVTKLGNSGMWISAEVKQRIFRLADAS